LCIISMVVCISMYHVYSMGYDMQYIGTVRTLCTVHTVRTVNICSTYSTYPLTKTLRWDMKSAKGLMQRVMSVCVYVCMCVCVYVCISVLV
jgi:uncharacterized protein (DUF486 family)